MPWVYYNLDGSTSIVGPVAKKRPPQNQKPREHNQLHSNRPAIITLLCLARDAAARLPDAVGTRADILELIQHSQYFRFDSNLQSQNGGPLAQTTTYEQLSVIISGALDRLHYEPD